MEHVLADTLGLSLRHGYTAALDALDADRLKPGMWLRFRLDRSASAYEAFYLGNGHAAAFCEGLHPWD